MAALPRALILLGLCYLSSSEDARCDDARCSGAADDTGLLQGSRRLAEAQRAEFPSPKDMYNALEDLGDEAVKKLKDRAEDHWKHYLKVARDAKDQAEIAADVAIKARNAARKYGSEALEKSADVIQKVLADAIAFKCDLLTRVAETILESLTSWWSSGTIDKKACKQMKSQSEKTCKLARLWPQEHWEDWIVDLCVNGSKTAIDWTCDEVKDLFHQTAVDIRNHMGAASLGCSGASWPFLYETALPQGSRRLLSSRSSERPARSRLDIFDDIGKGAKKAIDGVDDAAKKAGKAIEKEAKKAIDKAKDIIKGGAKAIQKASEDAVEKTGEAAREARDTLGEALDKVVEKVSGSVVDQIEDFYKKQKRKIDDAVDEAMEEGGKVADSTVEKARDWMERAEEAQQTAEDALDSLKEKALEVNHLKCRFLARAAEIILEMLMDWFSDGQINKKQCKTLKKESVKICEEARLWPGENLWVDWCVEGAEAAIDWTCEQVKDLFHQTAEEISKHMGMASLGC